MRKIVLYMSMSLDGFIAGEEGAPSAFEPSHEEHRAANDLFSTAGGVLFGRITYEGFASYWDALDPASGDFPDVEIEFARIFRQLRRFVFSRTLEAVDDKAVLIRDPIASRITALKQQPGGDLLLVCGPELLAALTALGLVDECLIVTHPVVLARGKALFGGLQQALVLRLLSTTPFASGAVMHRYAIVSSPLSG